MDSIETQCGGPDIIYVYFERFTRRYALLNWVQPFSYFDIRETCLFDVWNDIDYYIYSRTNRYVSEFRFHFPSIENSFGRYYHR
jgi:hypothetical protein